MASKKLPNSETAPPSETISGEAEFWFNQFLKHATFAFQDRCQSLDESPSHEDVQQVTIESLVDTLLESGASHESLIAAVGKMAVERDSSSAAWTKAMNERRVDLIDRDLQEIATLEEQVELAKLTAIMRLALDTEDNIPLAGAKQLHEKLLNLGQQEKPR
jgi:hypothetical protein